MTAAAAARLQRVERGTSAEDVVLALCAVLLGNGKSDKGLMTRMAYGGRHLKMCQIGMYIQEGDSQRGGQPCSDRCQRAHDAIALAADWLRANETVEQEQEPQPRQAGLWADREARGA